MQKGDIGYYFNSCIRENEILTGEATRIESENIHKD